MPSKFDLELDEALLKKRTVRIRGLFDAKGVTAAKVMDELSFLGAQSSAEITIDIDCDGGDIATALALYDYIFGMSRDGIATRGIVRRRCSSAASLVLQACQKRIAHSNSLFLIHGVEATFKLRVFGDLKGRMEEFSKRFEDWQDTVEKIYVRRTKQTPEEIRKIIAAGEEFNHLLTADEAKTFGFVDDVIKTI